MPEATEPASSPSKMETAYVGREEVGSSSVDLIHSDRGCQYTSHRYQALLADLCITVRMSRTGNGWDNADTESFFGTLKGECVALSISRSRSDARSAIFEYVETFSNCVRRH